MIGESISGLSAYQLLFTSFLRAFAGCGFFLNIRQGFFPFAASFSLVISLRRAACASHLPMHDWSGKASHLRHEFVAGPASLRKHPLPVAALFLLPSGFFGFSRVRWMHQCFLFSWFILAFLSSFVPSDT